MDLLSFHLPQTVQKLHVCMMAEFELNAINATNNDAQKAEVGGLSSAVEERSSILTVLKIPSVLSSRHHQIAAGLH